MENNKKPENPNAFPSTDLQTVHFHGMTLRDYFANSAMQSVIVSSAYDNCTGNNGRPVPEFVASESYLIADAMLKQREL